MCRALRYLGRPVPPANLLHQPDSALIRHDRPRVAVRLLD